MMFENETFDIAHAAEMKEYGAIKEYIEHYFGMFGKLVVERVRGEAPRMHSRSDIRMHFSCLNYFEGYDSPKETSFTKTWFSDPDALKYDDVVFSPHGPMEKSILYDPNSNVLNSFDGFATDFERVPYDCSQMVDILAPYHYIGRMLHGGNQAIYKRMQYYYAKILQNPSCQPRFTLHFINSAQGIGKDTYFGVFGKMLGERYVINSSNKDDFFGERAMGMYGKVLAIFNEAEAHSMRMLQAKMKMLATSPNWEFKPTSSSSIMTSNNIHSFVFSNKDPGNNSTFDAATKDRRNLVFYPSDELANSNLYNHLFWNKIYTHFNSPLFLTALFDYYMSFDLSKIDWKKWHKKCMTPEYKRQVYDSLPCVAKFFRKRMERFQKYSDYDTVLMLSIGESIGLRKDGSRKVKILNKNFHNHMVQFCREYGIEPFVLEALDTHLANNYTGVVQFELAKGGDCFYVFNTRRVLDHIEDKYISFSDIQQKNYNNDWSHVFKN